jgi:hypothetical protein
MVLNNPALKQIRKVAGDTGKQYSVTTTSSNGSNQTYGDFLNNNPALEAIEKVKSGGSISESEKNTSMDEVKESIQESTGNFRQTLKDAGVNPNEAFADPSDTGSQKINELINPMAGLTGKIGEIGETGGETVQGITDAVNDGTDAVTDPGSLLPDVQPQVNLGLGKIAKYGALTVLGYIVIQKVA